MVRKILFISLLLVFSNAATLTDVLDRQVEVKDGVKKVVLTFYFEEYFVTTGEEGVSKIVGWSKGYWKGRREATWQAFLKKFPLFFVIFCAPHPSRLQSGEKYAIRIGL